MKLYMEIIPGNENMQKIVKEFNTSQSADDLFLAWENELRLRRLLRNHADPDEIVIENAKEFDFIKRSLYFGPRQSLFFDILYRNASNIAVLNCILQSSSDLIKGFLSHMGSRILEHKPPVKPLQFIITMYSEEYRSDFIQLFNQMDRDLCTQLLTRTTNNNLRQIIKQRLQQPRDNQPAPDPAMDAKPSAGRYPTIFGDKLEIMNAAVKSLEGIQSMVKSAAPLNRAVVEGLLDCGDMLFRAGLLTDCLGILTNMANHPGTNQYSLLLSNQEPYYRQMDGLVGKALPLYAFLVNPADPHRYALDLYRGLFPGFGPDPASLVYLDIHSLVMAGLQGHNQYVDYEIAQKGSKILSIRPADHFASALTKAEPQLTEKVLADLSHDIEQRISSRPHESYIMMEVIRLWHRDGRVLLNRLTASSLLHNYVEFYNWIPAAPFMNEQIQNQLGIWADEKTKMAGEQIVNMIQNTHGSDSRKSDPDFNEYQPRLLLNKFMGVL